VIIGVFLAWSKLLGLLPLALSCIDSVDGGVYGDDGRAGDGDGDGGDYDDDNDGDGDGTAALSYPLVLI
jgi:hypothetical protein